MTAPASAPEYGEFVYVRHIVGNPYGNVGSTTGVEYTVDIENLIEGGYMAIAPGSVPEPYTPPLGSRGVDPLNPALGQWAYVQNNVGTPYGTAGSTVGVEVTTHVERLVLDGALSFTLPPTSQYDEFPLYSDNTFASLGMVKDLMYAYYGGYDGSEGDYSHLILSDRLRDAIAEEMSITYDPTVQALIDEARDFNADTKIARDEAKVSETNAKTSETKAKTSEDNANTSEDNAKTSEVNAEASEDNARGHADTATAKASQAETSATTATTKAGEAGGFRDEAEGFKNDASTQAGIATTRAGEAQGFRDEAEGFKNQALAARLSWKGAWDSGTAYVERDVVSHGGSSWWAKQPSTGVEPAEGATWSLVASKGEQGDGITDAADLTGSFSDQVDVGGMLIKIPLGDGSTFDISLLDGFTALDNRMGSVEAGKSDVGHTHAASDISGALTDQVDASGATVPDPNNEFTTQYPLSTFVQEMVAGVTGLANGLNNYSPLGHTHTRADITDLEPALALKADLDGDGKLSASQLPALAITEFLGTPASQSAMLALSGQRGDWCVRTDRGTQWILVSDNPAVIGSWREMVTPAAPVSSVAGRTGAVTLSRADVGLSNVDNTSDMNKPISNAVSTALGTKAATDHTHSEFARVAAAPATWRWNGTTLPTSASQVHAQARVGDFIVAPNLTTDPGWHQITGV